MRRPALQSGWYFLCLCSRCSSPAELGAELSTLRCDCGPASWVRPVRPQSQDTEYRCGECGATRAVDTVRQQEDQLKEELEQLYRSDVAGLQLLLTCWQDRFHPRHYLILIIKWLLLTTWGRTEGLKHSQMTEEELQRKVEYGREYLVALDIIDAGISHNRGTTLWELQSAQTFLANKQFQEERLAPLQFAARLGDSLQLTRQAIHCLQFNPAGSNEELMRAAALQAEQKLAAAVTAFSTF